MSRDGSEGWAIGPSAEARGGTLVRLAPTLLHYNGDRWTTCDPTGIGSQVAPDPQCAGVASLLDYKDANGGTVQVWLNSIARVPLERDDDPSNDDDFEAVATGTNFSAGGSGAEPVILRYRNGQWGFEDQQARAAIRGPGHVLGAVVFTRPDDGWILDRTDKTTASLFHWDGTQWVSCRADPHACGDTDGRTLFTPDTGDGFANDTVNGLVAAGDRVFAYGYRQQSDGPRYPLVIYHDRGGTWKADPADGGLDPAFGATAPDKTQQGEVNSLTALKRDDGTYEAWALGFFGDNVIATGGFRTYKYVGPPDAVALHLRNGTWTRFHQSGGPLDDYLAGQEQRDPATNGESLNSRKTNGSTPERMVMLPGPDGLDSRAYIAQSSSGRIFSYDPALGRWSVIPGERPPDENPYGGSGGPDGHVQALAPDQHGGVWVALKNDATSSWTGPGPVVYFFHLTGERHKSVFDEVPNPDDGTAGRFSGLAGDADGRVWLGTTGGRLFRYDRVMGWDSLDVPGWDPGRIVTRRSAIFALAVAPDGQGIAVGEKGRIADLSPAGVRLDDAAGTICERIGVAGPCGTSRDLHAAAIAPSGAALVAGDHLALLWRPPGGAFRTIERPAAAESASITSATLPETGRAWVTLDTGQVFAGQMDSGGTWQWKVENVDDHGHLLAAQWAGPKLGLRAIAVDGAGRGFAVGDQGLLLERIGDGDQPWQRVKTEFRDHFTAVALPRDGLDGTLIGSRNGLLLTRSHGQWVVVREADYFGSFGGAHREQTGFVSGLALLPGAQPGQLEAWAALEGEGPSAPNDLSPGSSGWADNAVNSLLHYSSDPGDPLLDPAARAQPLPDSPAPRPGEISFAAFGDTGCTPATTRTCMDPGGLKSDNEVVTQGVVDDILQRHGQAGGPEFSVFTGDTVGETSLPGSDAAEQHAGRGAVSIEGPVKLRRWKELVADRLAGGGVPMFGAIGSRDLSDSVACDPAWAPPGSGCTSNASSAPGENLMWRTAFAGTSAPWGGGDAVQLGDGAHIVPVSANGLEGAGQHSYIAGQARTHYAFDVVRDGKPQMRVAFVDTSERALTAGEGTQNPVEAQTTWLDQVLSARPAGEPAIVVSTTPTYSYGPGALSDTDSDSSSFEGVLLKDHVSLLVAGRVGWNGLYWIQAPGLHAPCPGDDYPSRPPDSVDQNCGATQGTPQPSTAQLAAAINSLGPPASQAAEAVSGVTGTTVGAIPAVIAASAGAGFGPDTTQTGLARQGFWHGYTTVRIDPSVPDGAPIIEQRPVLDWIAIRASDHTLHPGQRLTLHGFGREPVGMTHKADSTALPYRPNIRFDGIDSPAITHRFDLVEADPDHPYVPKVVDGNGNPHGYVDLDPSVGQVDPQTGNVTTGRGNHGRIYALAILSAGSKAASWPLVFEPRRSYKPPARKQIAVPPAVAPIRVLGLAAQSVPSQTPPSAPQTPPISADLAFPAPPALPGLPGVSAPPVTPPTPPAPPPPAAQHAPAGLDLTATPVGLTIPPPSSPIPPPAPPIQPAPPGGARKEARQRQAATAKSEEGAQKGSGEATELGGDLAKQPPSGAAMTRRDRARADQGSLTVMARRSQPSAWVLGLEWGGGITLMALALALGFTGVRPTPSRRRREARAAPAWLRNPR